MRSLDFVLKRLAFAIVTVYVAVTINFILFRALPGTAVTNLSRIPHATEQVKEAVAKEFGLDKSKFAQYVIYLRQLSHGNMGISYENEQPVWDNLKTALANTIPMVTLGTLVAIIIGVITGVISAWRRDTFVDHTSTLSAMAFYSFPTQWLALMLVILFAGVLPTGGMTDQFLVGATGWAHIKDVLKHMILPSLTVALTLYGEYTLVVRSAMLESLGEDYVLTARAKGLPSRTIVRRHAFRNAMLPTVTLIAISLGYIVAGQILIETVFSWPGIGRAVYLAVIERDYPMLQGAFLVLTLAVVVLNFAADLLYFRLDPRITE
jgi:ABC-type dipeptide/oligopeptide/nickel transport system permease component